MSRPAFNTLWQGEWPYKSYEGVGLHLVGLPTDEHAFTLMLMQHSCHPDATKRIIERIRTNGEDRLTVMSALHFDKIAVEMAALGVTMKIIPPQPGWEPRFPKSEWTEEMFNQLKGKK